MTARKTLAAAVAIGALTLSATPAIAQASAAMTAPKPTACSTPAAVASKNQTLSSNPEVASLQKVLPYLDAWQRAIARKDWSRAQEAAVNYELMWQGAEVYPNHRSLPLYVELEPDTQFVVEDLLDNPPVDWDKACVMITRMGQAWETALVLAAGSPSLTPIFQDLVKVREVRANLNQARNNLNIGDLAKAKEFIAKFNTGWPAVAGLVEARSPRAIAQIATTGAALTAALNDPSATAASVLPSFTTFVARVGQGVNVINAAARAADLHRIQLTAVDNANLQNLKAVLDGVVNSSAFIGTDTARAVAGGDTGPNSAFAKVQGPLEAQARYISLAPALRTALNNYASAARTTTSPTAAAVLTAIDAVRDQIEIDQQGLIGQFWSSVVVSPYAIKF